MKNIFGNIVIVLLTYFYIFSPPIQLIPISISNLLALWAYFYIYIDKNKIKAILLFKKEFYILFLILFYSIIIYIFSGLKSPEAIISSFKILFIDFPIAIALVSLYKNIYKIELSLYFKNIMIITFLGASLISISLLLNPDFNTYVKFHILRTLDIGNFQNSLTIRGFGFSDSLMFSYPIALALGACFILENYKNKILSIIIFILLIIPIFINARIGIVPIIAYLIFVVIFKRKFLLIFTVIVLIYLLFEFLNISGYLDQYSYFIDWNTKGYEDTLSIFQDNELAGNYYALSNMIFFPDNIIFGTGRYVFLGQSLHSDIGYILQIYYGGIVYIILIYYFYLLLIRRLLKRLSWNHWFPVTLLITVLLANAKGNFFSANPGMHTILLMYVFYILSNKIQKKHVNYEG